MMKHSFLFTLLILLLSSVNAITQRVAINETGAFAHESAILHVQSTNKGILIPRMTTAQRTAIMNPALGLMVYDLQTESFWFRNSLNQWVEFTNANNDFFTEGTHGIYTNETGIGVGAAPLASYTKFYGKDSINNIVHLALTNKHALGSSAIYLLDPTNAISGAFRFNNNDKHLYIQNGQSAGGDIIFQTNQFPETGNVVAEVMRLKRTGGLGLGTNNPGAKMHISNAASAMGLRVDNSLSTSAATYGIFNDNNTDGTGKKYGIFNRVYGKATSQDIYGSYQLALPAGHPMNAYAGYFEVDTAGAGTHYGVYTKAKGSGNYALYSENTSGDGWAGYLIGRTYLSGRLGIGIDTPAYRIHVVSSNQRSLHLETSHASSDTSYGIYNLIKPATAGVRYGMYTKVEMDIANTADVFGVRAQVEPDGTGTHWGVFGRANGDANIGVEGISTLTGIGVRGTNTNTNGWAGYFDGNTYVEDRLEIRDKIFLRPAGNASGGEIELFDNDGDETVTIRAGQSTDNGAEMLMYSDGNDLTIELDAQENGNGGAIILSDEEGDQTVIIRAAQGTANGAELLMHNDAGVLTVELDADFNDGKGRVITDELEITGGSDLAEHFDISSTEVISPGMLVSVDRNGSGKLIPTSDAYDKRVAGVVSGANGISPGMLMGQRTSIADGDYPVALVGRVYVLADATKTPIKAGDLMTSSYRDGYAMAVQNQKKAQGAIIGKALTELNDGTGYVLILVSLQ